MALQKVTNLGGGVKLVEVYDVLMPDGSRRAYTGIGIRGFVQILERIRAEKAAMRKFLARVSPQGLPNYREAI